MSITIPKRIFSLEEIEPGEKLYEVCIILKDIPGALAKATRVLADANVNVKTGSIFYAQGHPGVGCWSSFIDISKATRNISQLEEELCKLDVVVDARFEEPKPAPFEIIHFPVLHANTRAVIMPIGTIWALWDGLEKIMAPSGLAVLHYDAGKKTGEHAAISLRKMYGLEGADLISAFIQAQKATGWGIIELSSIDFKQPSATFIIRDCFEAVAWRKKPYKVCHWTRGSLAGFMSVVFGTGVEAVEVKCKAVGDEYCEFEIKKSI